MRTLAPIHLLRELRLGSQALCVQGGIETQRPVLFKFRGPVHGALPVTLKAEEPQPGALVLQGPWSMAWLGSRVLLSTPGRGILQ